MRHESKHPLSLSSEAAMDIPAPIPCCGRIAASWLRPGNIHFGSRMHVVQTIGKRPRPDERQVGTAYGHSLG